MLIIPMNLTPREAYRQFGTLNDDWMEYLFDAEEKLAEMPDISYVLDEISAQFPARDFLQEVIDKLQKVIHNTRDANREALTAIRDQLTEIQTTQGHATEYALDEAHKLIQELEKWY